MNSVGLLWVSMGLIPIMIGIDGMNWLVCLVGGTCHCALEKTKSIVFLVKDWVKLVFVLQWWSSLILFLIRASWIFLLQARLLRG